MRLHLFFFFEFWPDSAVTDRVGPILAASAPISAASARFGTCHVARRGSTRHGRAVCGIPAASLRPAALDAGTLAWEPRPCIPDEDTYEFTVKYLVK